jgi:hypothetical protein
VRLGVQVRAIVQALEASQEAAWREKVSVEFHGGEIPEDHDRAADCQEWIYSAATHLEEAAEQLTYVLRVLKDSDS